MARQLRLSLRRPAAHTRDAFVHGPSNAEATKALDAWPRWPGGTLVLTGSQGVGKTHLARAWAAQAKAVILDRANPDVAAAAGRPTLLEDVDQGVDAEALFHLINLAREDQASVLITARLAPSAFEIELRDLRSRLRAVPMVSLLPPDDQLFRALIVKFCADRQLAVDETVVSYLATRIERSFAAARQAVELLDTEALRLGRPVTRALAAELLRNT